MYNKAKVTKSEPGTKRPYDPTNNKTRGYRFLWAIYPDFWKESWGEKPVLGHVRADSEFHAKYAAYDKGLLPLNATFGPQPIKVAPKARLDNKQIKK